MSDNKFIAIVYRQKPCPKCDAEGEDPGFHERLDCGCYFTFEIGRYKTLNVARLVASKQAKNLVTRDGVKNTGHWNVETDEDGVVSAN